MNRTIRYLACMILASICRFASSTEVCASIGKHIISFDKDYVAFSPTLEGVDYWTGHDPARIKPVVCEDKVIDITIYFNWPEMSGAANGLFSDTPAPNRVSARIKAQSSPFKDMSFFRDFNTLSASTTQKDSVKYDSGLKLFGFRGDYGKATQLYSYYWADRPESKPWFFMMCTPLPSGELFTCEGQYFLESAQSLIVISFPAGLLNNWDKVIEDTNKFIVKALKN